MIVMETFYARLVLLSSKSQEFLPGRSRILTLLIQPSCLLLRLIFRQIWLRSAGSFCLLSCYFSALGVALLKFLSSHPSSGCSGSISGKSNREDYRLLLPTPCNQEELASFYSISLSGNMECLFIQSRLSRSLFFLTIFECFSPLSFKKNILLVLSFVINIF